MAKEPAPILSRSKTEAIDMDLAYGEAHPSALQRYEPPGEVAANSADDEEELQGLVAKAKNLLEEADCVQHSASATIAHLQKNPDAMAAVALTLAEISNLVSKMAPSILTALKASAPSVFALLASPQFLIAAGVGIGVTIVMFGGYKIIKKITAAPENANQDSNADKAAEPNVDELIELQDEHLSRVEMWRRGVADAEAASIGTSADGEFITPTAAAMSGIDLTTPPSRVGRSSSSKYEDMSTASSRRSRHSRRSRASTRPAGGEEPKKKKKEKSHRSNKLKLLLTV